MSNVLGVDVGVGSIKIVSMVLTNNVLTLETIGEAKTPKVDWMKPGQEKAIEEVASAVKMLCHDLKVKTRQVVACLPEDEVVSRLIHLPPLKESEVKDALRFEAETFVPYPLDQVSIDYEIIEQDDAGRLTVFAIAARNEVIQSIIRLFKMAGMEMVALESPAVAMRRTINASVGIKSGVIMVDMGEKYSDLIALNDGNVYFTGSMSVGGESLTRAISLSLGLDMASAEEYKKAYGMKEMELEGKIKNAITPVFTSMAEEIRRSMTSFREEFGKPIELLVLSGGGANLPGLAEELTKILGVEVQVIQPFIKVDSTKIVVPVDLNSEGCRFSLAVGLSLRGLI